MRLIRWTLRSRRDLQSIYDYICADSPHVAEVVMHRLIDASERIADFPEHGREVPEYARPDVREVIVRPYRIVYRLVAADEVHILTVHHGARLLLVPAPDPDE